MGVTDDRIFSLPVMMISEKLEKDFSGGVLCCVGFFHGYILLRRRLVECVTYCRVRRRCYNAVRSENVSISDGRRSCFPGVSGKSNILPQHTD